MNYKDIFVETWPPACSTTSTRILAVIEMPCSQMHTGPMASNLASWCHDQDLLKEGVKASTIWHQDSIETCQYSNFFKPCFLYVYIICIFCHYSPRKATILMLSKQSSFTFQPTNRVSAAHQWSTLRDSDWTYRVRTSIHHVAEIPPRSTLFT